MAGNQKLKSDPTLISFLKNLAFEETTKIPSRHPGSKTTMKQKRQLRRRKGKKGKK